MASRAQLLASEPAMNALHHLVTAVTATVLVFACSSSLVDPAFGRSPQRGALVETGDFHGDEVHARSGQRWLGLYVSNSGSRLVAVPVKVSRVNDPIVDDEKGRTGKRIETPGHPGRAFSFGVAVD